MADFVAVIRKAVGNLSENTPENRIKVYDKARAAIRRQLEAMNPQPADEVIARQLDKLNLAIDEVEIEHAEAMPAEDDEADALMAELESMVEKSPVIATPAVPAQAPAKTSTPVTTPPAPKPSAFVPVASQMTPSQADEADEPVVAPPKATARPSELVGSAHDEAFGIDSAPHHLNKTTPKRGSPVGKGRLLALALVLLLGVVAYAGWSYKDDISAMLGSSTTEEAGVTEEIQPVEDTAEVTPEPAPAEPATPAEPAVDDTEGAASKFTQRLAADGTETDAGPAPGPDVDDTGEGRSVAALTDAGPADETLAEESTAEAAVAPGDATAPNSQPLGVAQKMILYEERLGQQSLEVKTGTVVWTLVSEASGDGPDEQVIRGEINNPDTGLSALITFKRNTDPSLPASHIIEIVFAVPTDFAGGSIDQLQRIALKQTEADQGNPLIAVPAKITQDFYMVALNDLAEARKTNTDLMRQRNWIDIPVVYANGRQALITLEKGASGSEVFSEALDAWAKAEPQN